MSDAVQEFEYTLIFRQGLMDGFVIQPPKIALHFNFPKLFEIHFTGVQDYRAELPLDYRTSIENWSATRDSEFLHAFPERRRRQGYSLPESRIQLCNFHITFTDGSLDVLADDFVFIMVSR